uniref:Uncharacterized protein n=1 Tax=Accipiter nisus TaxID=211598 RepID=A0A8B9NK61_9AVES
RTSPAFCVKAFSHCRHLKGLSPVCMRRWVARWEDWRKSFPQTGHWYLRSPVWERRWRARCEEEMKALPQSGQAWGRSPVPTAARLLALREAPPMRGRSLHWRHSWLPSRLPSAPAQQGFLSRLALGF